MTNLTHGVFTSEGAFAGWVKKEGLIYETPTEKHLNETSLKAWISSMAKRNIAVIEFDRLSDCHWHSISKFNENYTQLRTN